MLKPLIEKLNKTAQTLRQSAAVRRRAREAVRQAERSGSTETAQKRVRLRRVVTRQAMLAGGAVLLVAVLLFAYTTAWYTNVSKTGSLEFRTESWGFADDGISIAGGVISAMPGRSGVVPLSVNNATADGVRAVVTASKAGMASELRQRLYVYADTSATRGGETVSRVYLGPTDEDGFTYDLLAGERLELNERFYTATPLRWMWVYDLVGYYFRGTVDGDSVTVEEYLRPIEYDLDTATFDGDGNLTYVNDVSAASFRSSLAASDGYEGSFGDPVTTGGKTYYPVSVSSGSGVWAYFLTYAEIQAGIAYDSDLAADTAASASLTVTVQNLSSDAAEAGTDLELGAQLASGANVVRLTDDIDFDTGVPVPANRDIVLDLNGYRLRYTGGGTAFTVPATSSLTLLGGSFAATSGGTALAVNGGGATLSGVTLSGFADAISGRGDALVRVTDSGLTVTGAAIIATGNGTASDAPARYILLNSTVSAGNYGVSGVSDTDKWGTDIVIHDCTVSGGIAGVYHPQQRSSALLSGSDVTGGTGVAVCGGHVTVYGGTVNGTGTGAVTGNEPWNNGSGVCVYANRDWSALAEIDGAAVESTHSYAVDLYGDAERGPGRVLVRSGTFTSVDEDYAARWNGIGSIDHPNGFNVYDSTT